MESYKIGTRIKMLRKSKGETQAQLAKAIFVKRETVNLWENEKKELKPQYIVLLSKHFNVTCDYILVGIKSENLEINRQLGLSDKSIDKLKNLNNIMLNQNNNNLSNDVNICCQKLKAINFMLENEENKEGHNYFELLSDCLFSEYEHKQGIPIEEDDTLGTDYISGIYDKSTGIKQVIKIENIIPAMILTMNSIILEYRRQNLEGENK